MLMFVASEQRHPRLAKLRPAGPDTRGEVLVDPVGNQELGLLGPAVAGLGLFDLCRAQRLAVRHARVDDVGRAVADVAVDDDEGWSLRLVPEHLERLGERTE